MKKVLIPLVIILAIVVLLPPALTGSKAKTTLDELSSALLQDPAYSVTWESYNKGWFSSDGIVEISVDLSTLDIETFDDTPSSFKFEFTAKHGLFLFTDTQALGLFSYSLKPVQEEIDEFIEKLGLEKGSEFYTTSGVMDLSGTLHMKDNILAFSVYEEDGDNIRFGGYSGEGTLAQGEKLSYKGVFGGLSFVDKTSNFEMKEINFNMEADLGQWLSETLFASDMSLNITDWRMSIEGQNIDFGTSLIAAAIKANDNDTFDIAINYTTSKLDLPEQSVEDLTVKFGYENITPKLYDAYVNNISTLENFDDPSQIFTPEIIDEALQKGLALSIEEVSMSLPQGKFNASANVSISPDSNISVQTLNQNPLALVNALLMDTDVTMDKTLARFVAKAQVEQSIATQLAIQQASGAELNLSQAEIDELVDQSVDSTITTLIQQGFMIESDNQYKSVISMKDGQANINGTELPLQNLLQGVL